MAQPTDSLLLPILLQGPEQESEEQLARLITEHAAPVIKNVIRGKLHVFGDEHPLRQDAEDIYGDVVVQLLTRLRAFIANPADSSIGSFRGYVAVTTYNACHLYLRHKYPERWRLKNRLRYELTHRNDFALWEAAEGEWLCGRNAWHLGKKDLGGAAQLLRQLTDDPAALKRAGLSVMDVSKAPLTELLQVIFRHTGAPVPLDDLVRVVADLQGVRDQRTSVGPEAEKDFDRSEGELDASPDFATEVERRSYLRRLWTEISQLPPLQRAALLLNLRDAQEGVIALLPLAGVASVREIAQAVGMPDEKFARLWNDLPLEDAAIAELLDVTRQQVINLRKAARARLRRRMQEK